jgi:hypothetical protein
MTNNLKYYKSPTIANQSPEDFLDTFYNDKSIKSNIVNVGNITPLLTDGQPRVGYWNSKIDTFY